MRPSTQSYIVTDTDYFGNDYVRSIDLTPQEARDRIKDGRLLSAAAGHARNYARLWDAFKAQDRYGPTVGRMPTERENELLDYKRQNNIV
jgi:hypothetical protein